VRNDYAPMAPAGGRDEISALGVIVAQAGTDLRRRAAEIVDREDALQRHVGHTTDEVAAPLSAIEQRLIVLGQQDDLPASVREELHGVIGDAHHARTRLENLAAVARLRTVRSADAAPVDVGALARRVVARLAPVAAAARVTIDTTLPSEPIVWPADEALLERAVANLVDNAIRYNKEGGTVWLALEPEPPGRFTLRVTDDGLGVDEETFAALSAKGRFRGDESRDGRPGRGLGLAVAREVADRFGLRLTLSRPRAGGFEVTLVVRSG
jgi:signal transduction histidine kinase